MQLSDFKEPLFACACGETGNADHFIDKPTGHAGCPKCETFPPRLEALPASEERRAPDREPMSPCPWCGSDGLDTATFRKAVGDVTVLNCYECARCGLGSPSMPNEESARHAWNRMCRLFGGGLTLSAIQEIIRDETPSLSEIGAELRRELDRRPPPMPTEQAYAQACIAYYEENAKTAAQGWDVFKAEGLAMIAAKERAAHLAAQAEKGRAK